MRLKTVNTIQNTLLQDELRFFNSNRIKSNLNLKHISNNGLDPKSEFVFNNLQDIDSYRKISQSLAKSWIGNFELNNVKNICENYTAVPIYSYLVLLDRKVEFFVEYNLDMEKNCVVDRKNEILMNLFYNLIAFSTMKINEKIKNKILLLVNKSDDFDLTFYFDISKQIFFKRNIKYFVRKFMQELFVNIDIKPLLNEINLEKLKSKI